MIVGITGSFGAGKGAVADYLVKNKGFHHLSARALITEEVKRRGLEVDRDTLTEVANDMRAEGGPTYIYKQLINTAKDLDGDVVIESIRAVAEVKHTKENGGIVMGVDAEPLLRYERAVSRGSETDHVSYEKWRQQELAEMNTDDPTKQNVFGALELSDYMIENNGTLEELHQKVDDFLQKYQG